MFLTPTSLCVELLTSLILWRKHDSYCGVVTVFCRKINDKTGNSKLLNLENKIVTYLYNFIKITLYGNKLKLWQAYYINKKIPLKRKSNFVHVKTWFHKTFLWLSLYCLKRTERTQFCITESFQNDYPCSAWKHKEGISPK